MSQANRVVARLRANTSGSLDPLTVGGAETAGETPAEGPGGDGPAAAGRDAGERRGPPRTPEPPVADDNGGRGAPPRAGRRRAAAARRRPGRTPPRQVARTPGRRPGPRTGAGLGRRRAAGTRIVDGRHRIRASCRGAGVARRRTLAVQGLLNARGERPRT